MGVSLQTFLPGCHYLNLKQVAEIARVGCYYAVQGHSRSQIWYQSKACMRLPISD